MRFRLFRLGISFIWIAALITLILLYFYYYYASSAFRGLLKRNYFLSEELGESAFEDYQSDLFEAKYTTARRKIITYNDTGIKNRFFKIEKFFKCLEIDETDATINTLKEYQNFDFDADWISKKTIWNEKFETKFQKLSKDLNRPPLHIVVMPHSHNDPGWLKTFEEYFQSHTHKILDNAVKKLPQLNDLTFIWTEISFLELWWRNSDENKRKVFKELVQSGRIEIMTGGWVMTDEAAAHVYAMVDQLIEGHQWVKKHLNVTPKHSWSIDPFGHGSTMPYIYGAIDFEGSIIQRIHYNWKEWLASRQFGDFLWRPSWNIKQHDKYSMLTHNMPFDMYFVDSSCGPHVDKCKPYDFRWFGAIRDAELPAKADQLVAEYARSASLYPHNTFLAIVGGDFRYEVEYEFDYQYNYKKIIDYVNANPDRYNNTKMQFGTPKDYFKVIRERTKDFPTLTGDLLPYGDVFTNGDARYWTGYYTTRPFLKIMSRVLEHNLRSAEILFTFGLNRAKQAKYQQIVASMEKIYQKLILARRNLALFQHHDAITGTSRAKVMQNYLSRMFDSLKDTIQIQQLAIETISQEHPSKTNVMFSMLNYTTSNALPENVKLDSNMEIILFNSLAHERFDVVVVHVTNPNVEVFDADGSLIQFQVNPVFMRVENSVKELENEFEILFVVKLPALSLSKFSIKETASKKLAEVKVYTKSDVADIEIKNSILSIQFDKVTGLVNSLKHVNNPSEDLLELNFGAYKTAIGKSGAYLFKPNETDPEVQDIFVNDQLSKIIVVEGELASFVKVFYGQLLIHSVRLLNTHSHLDEGLYIENQIKMNDNHSNFELFMRLKSPIKNQNEFFTDLNGFQWQRRQTVSKIKVDGNYYPITIGAFIQDQNKRMTLLTNHAQGATSPSEGVLEVMMDRRTPKDDQRGMEEGVTDNIENIQKHWITFEYITHKGSNFKKYQVPSIHAASLSDSLKYPITAFGNFHAINLHQKVEMLINPFPCEVDLFNLRTLTTDNDDSLPSQSALFIIQQKSYDCKFFISNGEFYNKSCDENSQSLNNLEIFSQLHVKYVQETSLTGLKTYEFASSFNQKPFEPMEMRTFNVTFY